MEKELKKIIISNKDIDELDDTQREFNVVKKIGEDHYKVVCDKCGSKECEFWTTQQKIYCPKCVYLEFF